MSFFAMSIATAIAVSAIGIRIALPAKTYRTAKNPGWWVWNLTKLLAVLAVGLLLSATLHLDLTTDEPLRLDALLGGFVYALVVNGVLTMPMGVVYLAVLAFLSGRWSPKSQRMTAVVLSPMVTSLYWLAGVQITLETVAFALGVPFAYSLILTLPRPRDDTRDVASGATLTNGTTPGG